MVAQTKGQKMVVMSENDTIPSLDNLQKDKAAWLYFCPWYQRYLTELTSAEELKKIYTSDYCITLDELPDWDTYDPELPDQTTVSTVKTTTATQPKASMLGDVNNDQNIDVSDAVLLARFLAEDKTAVLTAEGKLNADCDQKAGLSSEDMVRILQYIAKMITKEEFEQKL